MDESYIAKLREIHTENVDGTEGSWVPWNVAAEKEGGEDLLKEMVEAGTVLCRRNTKLPATTKIPWPQNQECRHVLETFSRKKRRVESESKEDGAGEVDTFNESFHTKAAHVTASTNPPQTHKGAGTPNTNPPQGKPNPVVDPASKAAITNINAACNNKQ